MLLLDTHAFLWFLSDDSRLPSEVYNGPAVKTKKEEIYREQLLI